MLFHQKNTLILTSLFMSGVLLSGCHGTEASSSLASASDTSTTAVSSSGDIAFAGISSESEKNGKVAYLTFDDGPTEMTPKIIEVLKEHDAKATFFVVYKSSEKAAEYMKSASDEGNEIAAHSYCHNYKQIYRSVDTFTEDFEKVSEWIEAVTGKQTKQLRFPGGSSIGKKYLSKPTLNEILSALHDKGIVHHDWNVSSGDANGKMQSKEKILENIKNEALKHDEPVILMHDIERNQSTLEALPEIIEWLRENGYSFDTVSNIKHPAQHRKYSPAVKTESFLPNSSVPPLSSHIDEVLPPPSSAASAPPVESEIYFTSSVLSDSSVVSEQDSSKAGSQQAP